MKISVVRVFGVALVIGVLCGLVACQSKTAPTPPAGGETTGGGGETAGGGEAGSAPAEKPAEGGEKPAEGGGDKAAPPSGDAKKLVGTWASKKFEGPQCVPQLQSLEITMDDDGNYDMIATLKEGEETREAPQNGTWKAEGSTLTLTTPGQPTITSNFKFNEAGELIIKDSTIDCTEYYGKK